MRFFTLFAVSFLMLSQSACSSRTAAERDVVYQPVTKAVVHEQQNFSLTRAFTGVIEPAQAANVAFEFGGTVQAVMVNEGDRVVEGQLLARLDTALLEIERRRLQAQLKEAQANLRLTLENLKRQASLEVDGHASRQRRDELVASRDTFEAGISQLEAALDGNFVRQNKSHLYAPFAGVISERFLEQGSSAAPGQSVLRVLEVGKLEAHVGVPKQMAGNIVIGDVVDLRVAGESMSGEVVAVGGELKQRSHAVMIRVALPLATVPAGSVVELLLEDRIDEVGFVVPEAALTASMRGLWRIYVLTAQDNDLYRIEARDLQLRYSGEAQAYVTSGLRDGESIVANGVHKVVPGQLVRLGSAG